MLLHLVRHAPPLVERAAPASTWPLDPGRREAVEPLRRSGVLPAGQASWYSSGEPKALETAVLLSGTADVAVVTGLGEAGRPAGWMDRTEFEDSVSRSFASPAEPARPGWEVLDDVRARLIRALDEVAAPAAGRGPGEVVLVGHGTAWTVLVAALTGAAPDLVAWRTMTMPDHCLLELGHGNAAAPMPGTPPARVVRHWGAWRAAGSSRHA